MYFLLSTSKKFSDSVRYKFLLIESEKCSFHQIPENGLRFYSKTKYAAVKLEAKQHVTFLEKKGNGKETLFLHTFLLLYKKQPFF